MGDANISQPISQHLPVYVVIMAGGAGTRFWPQSRLAKPKQFLNLWGEESILAATVRRALLLTSPERCLIMTEELYGDIVKEIVPHIPAENIICEPVNRDTAPCLGLAAMKIQERCENAIMIVLPSDHYIEDEEAFVRTLQRAANWAAHHSDLTTVGIKPSAPQTAYGYLDCGKAKGKGVYEVKKFLEKPSLPLAKQFVSGGNYLWNSGIFIWQTVVLLAAMKEHLPELGALLSNWQQIENQSQRNAMLQLEYVLAPKISIDYGIMEKAINVAVVPADFCWDDVGSWQALEKYLPKDEKANSLADNGRHVGIDTKRCIISVDKGLVATIGLEDMVIVRQGDILLIAPRERDQEVKKMVQKLAALGLEEYL